MTRALDRRQTNSTCDTSEFQVTTQSSPPRSGPRLEPRSGARGKWAFRRQAPKAQHKSASRRIVGHASTPRVAASRLPWWNAAFLELPPQAWFGRSFRPREARGCVPSRPALGSADPAPLATIPISACNPDLLRRLGFLTVRVSLFAAMLSRTGSPARRSSAGSCSTAGSAAAVSGRRASRLPACAGRPGSRSAGTRPGRSGPGSGWGRA